MRLLVIDFETQGSDPSVHLPTEVGAVLLEIPSKSNVEAMEKYPDTPFARGWSEDGNMRELGRLSELIYHVDYPPQTEEIVDITGITDEMLQEKGIAPAQAFQKLNDLMLLEKNRLVPDFIFAHNADFDRGVYETSCKRLGLEIIPSTWLCTVMDFPWPKKYKCKKLSHLAYDHSILVDPKTLHRAINDVDLLIQLVGKYKFQDILAYKNTPWIYVKATIPGPWQDGGKGTTAAKKLGYGWEKIWGTDLSFPKTWCKRIKLDMLEKEIAQSPFPVTRLGMPDDKPIAGDIL